MTTMHALPYMAACAVAFACNAQATSAPEQPKQLTKPAIVLPAIDKSAEIPVDLRRKYSEYIGKRIAAGIQYTFEQLVDENQKPLIDAEIAKKAFLEHLDKKQDMDALIKDAEPLEKQYSEAMKTYETALAAAFLKENAQKPGVKTLENGIQYTVTTVTTDKNNHNYRIDEANTCNMASLRGTTIQKMSDSSGIIERLYLIPDELRESLLDLPEGTTWTLYIPTSLLSPRSDSDAPSTVYLLTLSVENSPASDTENRNKDIDSDIEDEE